MWNDENSRIVDRFGDRQANVYADGLLIFREGDHTNIFREQQQKFNIEQRSTIAPQLPTASTSPDRFPQKVPSSEGCLEVVKALLRCLSVESLRFGLGLLRLKN
jgi:hypothetical protein